MLLMPLIYHLAAWKLDRTNFGFANKRLVSLVVSNASYSVVVVAARTRACPGISVLLRPLPCLFIFPWICAYPRPLSLYGALLKSFSTFPPLLLPPSGIVLGAVVVVLSSDSSSFFV